MTGLIERNKTLRCTIRVCFCTEPLRRHSDGKHEIPLFSGDGNNMRLKGKQTFLGGVQYFCKQMYILLDECKSIDISFLHHHVL